MHTRRVGIISSVLVGLLPTCCHQPQLDVKLKLIRAVLDEAARNCDTNAWPYPVIAYMRGELSPEALLAAASNNDRKTEAHAYMGMDLLLRGRVADAREHFVWVKEYGNKRFLEYPLAVAELARLGL